MKLNNRFKQLRGIETGINKHLYLICGIITIVVMIMTLTEFFTRGRFAPARMNLFYLGVLVIYSLHKELIRWLGKRKIERQGEYFVFGWITFTTLLYIINFLSKDYFSYSVQGEPTTTLRELSILSLEVLAIFILTRYLKILKILLVKPKSR